MTTMQMLLEVASTEAVRAIGEESARDIFYAIANNEKPSGRTLIDVARLSTTIGEDKARAIFAHLMNI